VLQAGDGTQVPVSLACSALPDGETESLCLVATDLTARYDAEAEIRELNQELEARVEARTAELAQVNTELRDEIILRKEADQQNSFQAQVLDKVAQAVIATDLAMTVLYWNSAAEQLYGWSSAEAVGRNAFELISPQASFEQGQAIMAALVRGESWRGEYLVQDRHGRTFPVDAADSPFFAEDGTLIGIIGVSSDITARKQAEEAVAAVHRQLQGIIDNTPAIVYAFDLEERFVLANTTLAALFNTTPAQMIGKRRHAFMPMEDADWHEANDRQAIKAGKALEFEEYSQLTDRSITWLTTKFPLRDAEGRIYAVAGISADITARKQAEEALQISLREKEVLLKEIHHRVKNNMQVISSLVSLQADTLDDPALRALFNDLRDQVRTMALVHEKLYQSESLAHVDFAEYAESLLTYLWRAHGEAAVNIQLTLDVQPVSISIEQAVPCGLILNELVTNALKHAFRDHAGGELAVTLHADPDGTVYLTVRDNGVGLPADWRQSPSLGLQLVQMLTRQVRGTLDVRTDGGTAFALTFAQPTSPQNGEHQHV